MELGAIIYNGYIIIAKKYLALIDVRFIKRHVQNAKNYRNLL
jgi:hypothetical protein